MVRMVYGNVPNELIFFPMSPRARTGTFPIWYALSQCVNQASILGQTLAQQSVLELENSIETL